ncbi:MAG: hydrolase [Cycloclasticus sp. symbiont of Poecilosclerida sp. M]|nr:MAG: hydrolase [Cycloclasticus sp. symbiont of Poecilosclerida sp. M]
MQEDYIQAANRRIRSVLIGKIDANKPTLVFLHGGIDCIEMWRDFPQQVHEETQLPVIVYERWGHGKSEPLSGFRKYDTRPVEADEPLADLFKHYGLDNVILVGHSYGAVVSLIAASHHAATIRGVVSIVPQMVIHPLCLAGVDDAKESFENGNLRVKLVKFHGESVDTLFYDWINRVNDADYQARDCADYLSQIACPVLQIYGKDDVYGYLPNLGLSKKLITSDLSILEIPGAGHYVHLEATDDVIDAIKKFITHVDA